MLTRNGGSTSRVAVLARVQVEHEVDQRAREPRAGAAQHREPRAGDLRAALEVDDAERRPEIPVRLRLEVERARRRRRRRTSTLSAALLPTGTLACGRFGSDQQPAVALLLDRRRARRSSCLICCARCAVGLLDLRACRAPAASPARLRRPTCSARASALRARGSAAGARVSSVGELLELARRDRAPRLLQRRRARPRGGRGRNAGSSMLRSRSIVLCAIAHRVVCVRCDA